MKLKTGKMARLIASSGFAMAMGVGLAMADDIQVDKGGDITRLCGDKPARVALVDGYGGDTWRKTTLGELKDEASKCKNITDVAYAEAGGDPQQYASLINGFSSQGYDIILAFTDFGTAAMPAYRSALEGGTIMVPYFSDIGGKAGVDYTLNPFQNSFAIGQHFAKWIGGTLKGKGNVLMLGGPAGAASSTVFMKGFKDGLKAFPDLKLLSDNYIVTNWNPADAQKAAAGLIAQYPQIDAIASDYGATSLATVKAFEQAGLKVPAMAAIATSNEYSCKYLKAKAAGKAWKYLALDGSTADIRFALRQAMAKFEGTTTDEPLGVVPYVYADSETGVDPKCDEKAPPDADLSSLLPVEKLNALFQH